MRRSSSSSHRRVAACSAGVAPSAEEVGDVDPHRGRGRPPLPKVDEGAHHPEVVQGRDGHDRGARRHRQPGQDPDRALRLRPPRGGGEELVEERIAAPVARTGRHPRRVAAERHQPHSVVRGEVGLSEEPRSPGGAAEGERAVRGIVGERVDHQHQLGRALRPALVDPQLGPPGAERPVHRAKAVARLVGTGAGELDAVTRPAGEVGARRGARVRVGQQRAQGRRRGQDPDGRLRTELALPTHQAERSVHAHPHRPDADDAPAGRGRVDRQPALGAAGRREPREAATLRPRRRRAGRWPAPTPRREPRGGWQCSVTTPASSEPSTTRSPSSASVALTWGRSASTTPARATRATGATAMASSARPEARAPTRPATARPRYAHRRGELDRVSCGA